MTVTNIVKGEFGKVCSFGGSRGQCIVTNTAVNTGRIVTVKGEVGKVCSFGGIISLFNV